MWHTSILCVRLWQWCILLPRQWCTVLHSKYSIPGCYWNKHLIQLCLSLLYPNCLANHMLWLHDRKIWSKFSASLHLKSSSYPRMTLPHYDNFCKFVNSAWLICAIIMIQHTIHYWEITRSLIAVRFPTKRTPHGRRQSKELIRRHFAHVNDFSPKWFPVNSNFNFTNDLINKLWYCLMLVE